MKKYKTNDFRRLQRARHVAIQPVLRPVDPEACSWTRISMHILIKQTAGGVRTLEDPWPWEGREDRKSMKNTLFRLTCRKTHRRVDAIWGAEYKRCL